MTLFHGGISSQPFEGLLGFTPPKKWRHISQNQNPHTRLISCTYYLSYLNYLGDIAYTGGYILRMARVAQLV